MEAYNEGEKTIKSTRTAFDIVESVAALDRPSVSEIAAEVGYSRSTVHYHLATLRQSRHVVRDDDGFRLGLRFVHLGERARGRHALDGIVEEPTDDLAADSGAVAHVGVPERDQVVWLYRSDAGDLDGLRTDVGTGVDMHCTAYGQAILAHLPSETVESLLATRGLPQYTEETISDEESLFDRLATVRELGFAYSAEEFAPGISSVAAPIVDSSTDEVAGTIGVTDRHDRIADPYKHTKARRFSDELPGSIRRAAQIVGDNLVDE